MQTVSGLVNSQESQENQRSTVAMGTFNHNQLHVAELNNLGVLCLERRHFSHAHRLFREALRYTVGAAATIQADAQEHELPRSCACETNNWVWQGESGSAVSGVATRAHYFHTTATLQVPSTSLLPLPAAPVAPAAPTRLQREDSNDLASSFHSQGFSIDAACLHWLSASEPSALLRTEEDGMTVCSAIATFNVALIYHSAAVLGYKGSTKLLEKARMLYQKCLQLLLCHGAGAGAGVECNPACPVRRPANSTIDLLHMAVLTNLAHVHFELLDFTRLCDYQRHLAIYVSSLGPLSLRYPDTRVAHFMELQTGNHLLNMFYTLRPSMVAQAA
jgi:hypothetical protein